MSMAKVRATGCKQKDLDDGNWGPVGTTLLVNFEFIISVSFFLVIPFLREERFGEL